MIAGQHPTAVRTSPIRGVLFDKDGTLLDYARTWTPINREVALLAARGDAQLAETLLSLGGQDPLTGHVEPGSPLAAGTHHEVAEIFTAHLGAATPPSLAFAIQHAFETGGARHAVLVDDALTTLARLSAAGLILGVASNDTAGGIAASLGRHPGVLGHFRFLAGCDSGHGAKPEPGMALAFAAATGIDPASIAIVGDAVHDLEMGRRAGYGLRVGVTGGTSPAAALAPHADMLVDCLADLVRLLTGRS